MTRSRKKKAPSEAPEAGEAQGQSTMFLEGMRTPEFPEIGKDSELFLIEELQEALNNLEAWWAQGAPELQEGHTEGFSKFTKDLGMGLRYALNYIKTQNKTIIDFSEKVEKLENDLRINEQQLQEMSAKNADIVNEADAREKMHQKETFRRDNKLVAPNIVIKNLPFQENEDAKTLKDQVGCIFRKLGAPPESLNFTKKNQDFENKERSHRWEERMGSLGMSDLREPSNEKRTFFQTL